MTRNAFAYVVVSFVMTCCCVTASSAACGDPAGNRSGVEFKNVSVLRALTLLGKQQNVCIAVEGVDKDTLLRTVSGRFTDAGADEVLRRLFVNDNIHIGVSDGILHVRGLYAPIVPLLEKTIPVLELKRPAILQAVSNLLFMELATAVDPKKKGFAGHIDPGDGEDLIGPFVERGRTVRQLLTSLIKKKSTGAMWVIPSLSPQDAMNPRLPFWRILEYNDPNIDLRVDLVARMPIPAPPMPPPPLQEP